VLLIEVMKKKILLVDDVRLFLKLEETFFKRTGCGIITAESGTEALRVTAEQMPDLILLDYIMPDVMGDEVCRRLKADPKTGGIPIIIVSTSADPADMQKCFDAGADEYVTKPINPQEILSKAAGMLEIPHRAHCRTQVNFQVEGAYDGQTFIGFTKNISPGGMLLECGQPIECDVGLTMDLPILENQNVLTLNGTVVRCDHDNVKGNSLLGIQFLDLKDHHKHALEKFVNATT